MKNRKWVLIATIITVLIIFCFLIFVNIKNNGWKDFFKIDFLGIIELILTATIATFIVNSQTKSSKKKENFERIIDKFQLNFTNTLFEENYNEDQKTKILTFIRKTTNQLGIMKRYSKKYPIENKICKLEEKSKEYHDILSDHICDDISQYKNELNRISENIDTVCEEIKIDIYS